MISSLYPDFDIIEPMKINKFKDELDFQQTVESGEYLASEKKDGAFYQVMKNAKGEVAVFSRTVSKKTGFFVEKGDNVPHIVEWAKTYLPNDTTLVTEIYYPGKTSKDVTRVMGCLADKAIERQEGNPIHVYVHDVLRWAGIDLVNKPTIERVSWLEYIPDVEDYVDVAKYYTENQVAELNAIWADGGEGMVFKKASAVYSPGKRPRGYKKAKTEDELDAVIMGFVEPERTYTGKELDSWLYWENDTPVTKAYHNGWKAGIEVGLYLSDGQLVSIGTVTSGMTDFLRQDMAANPVDYLGKVASLQCMSIDSEEHTMRHSRLLEIRGDKPASDCVWESVFH